jgi:tetratricopeptide (TPR) repeat protein
MGSSSTEVERLLQAARLHLAKGGLEEAVERASEAIRLDAKEPSAYVLRAEAHRKLKRPDRALADLAVAIRLDPNQPGPYVIRAEILKRRNLFDQAIADASHAIIIDARSAAAYSIRAECRSAIGDRDGAIEDVQEMVSIDPTRPVPDLRDRSVSGDPTPAMELEDERFWKQSGHKPSNDTTVFADGKPVDKTYRARRVVSNDDAPEALGVASGYKPETISRPIPRMHGQNRNSSSKHVGVAFLALGAVVVAGCALGMVLRGGSGPVASPKPASQPLQVTRADPELETLASAPPSAAERSKLIASEIATRISAPRPATNRPKPTEIDVARSVPVVSRMSVPTPKVDLKALLNPRRDSAGSRWEELEGDFVSPEGGSIIRIPYNPPPEYRLTVKVLKGSKHMVGIGLVTAPTSVLITLDHDPDGSCVCRFAVDEGRGITFHSGSRVLPLFEMSTVVCTVRKNSITVEVNGREIGRWDGDFRRLSVHPAWAYGGNGLFIGSFGKGTVIRDIELEPVLKGINTTAAPSQAIGSTTPESVVKDLGAFTLTKDGRRWNVEMPQHFTKAEVSFYRGVPSDLTLNAAWKGHLQVNGKDVVRFKKRSEEGVWCFHDFTTAADYKETYEYKKDAPKRYIDITKYLRPGDNSFYYYHEQGRDHSLYYYQEEGRNVPMGVILRLTE